METRSKKVRLLTLLLAFILSLSPAVTVFAGGLDGKPDGDVYYQKPSPGSGTGGSAPPVPGWHHASNNCFKQAGRFFCIRAEYRVAYAEILFAVF